MTSGDAGIKAKGGRDMTITDTTPHAPALPGLRALSDDQLAAAYGAADLDNPAVFAAFMAEFDQRAAAERAAKARQRREQAERRLHDEWYDQLHAQRSAFEAEGCGYVVNAEGKRQGISEWALWTGKAPAEEYGTREFRDFIKHSPLLTLAEYKRQRRADGRIQRDEWRDRDEITTTEGGTSDEHDGLDRDEAGALRSDAAAPQAPQRAGRTVPGHRRDHGPAEDSAERTADGGAGRPVRRRTAVNATVAVPASTTAAGGQEPRIPGDQLLDLIRDAYLGHYARFPSPAALDAVTLWAAHAHMRDENGVLMFRATPRLYLLSSEPGSGKSFVLELVGRVVPSWYGLDLEPTATGLVHSISKEHATVTLDEADIMLGAGGRHEAVRAVINGGTYRHGTVLNGRGAKANRASVFGPLALAGLDSLETGTGDKLTALLSRGVKIRMEKASGENRPPKLTRDGEEAAEKAKMWLGRWAAQVRDEVANAEPEIPEGIEGRTEDIWAPLLSVAQAAGGEWPARARAACLELALGKPDCDEDLAAEFAEFTGSFGQL